MSSIMDMKKLSIALAFLIVLIIWSTTPLAIKWSSSESAMGSAFLRMILGTACSVIFLVLVRDQLPLHKSALALYSFSGVTIFICMSLFYLAAQHIPSGWIAVLFGLSPLLTGIFSAIIEPESKLTPIRVAGILLGFGGLYLVFSAGLNVAEASLLGIALTVLSTAVSSAASVITRRLVNKANLSGLQSAAGSTLLSLPLFAIATIATQDVSITTLLFPELSNKAWLSTIYLGVIGTGVGFSLHYYLLKNINASRVALITLATPILALMIGGWIDNEPISTKVWLGALLVCAGLLVYEFKPRLGLRKLSL